MRQPSQQCFTAFADTYRIFENLSLKTQNQLHSIASTKEIDEGVFIGHNSQFSDGVYLILGGAARASTLDENGNQLYFSTSSDGEIYGLFSVMSEKPNIHLIKVIKPMKAIFLPAKKFRNLVYADRQLCERIIKFICSWLKDFSDLSNRFTLMKPIDRITHCLADIAPVYLTDEAKKPIELKLSISQYELSGMLALSRQSINNHLKRLEVMGILSIGYKTITIRDLARLRRTKY